MSFYRKCPNENCDEILTYSSLYNKSLADEKNTKCRKCCQPKKKINSPPEGIIYSRKCPGGCEQEIVYKSKSALNSATKDNRCCRHCYFKNRVVWNKGLTKDDHVGLQILSEKNRQIIFDKLDNRTLKTNKGKSKENCEGFKNGGIKSSETKRIKYNSGELVVWNKGLTKETDFRVFQQAEKQRDKSPELRQKLREYALNRILESGKWPSFNKTACEMFDEINKEMNWNGVHALNGGEFSIAGYSVDYYEPNLNIVIEYYEMAHRKRKEKDSIREQNIINAIQCKFYIIREWENKSWKDILFA